MCVIYTRILLVALVAALALGPAAQAKKRDAVCATVKKGKKAPYVVIFSAFPAEARPIIAHMTYESQVEIGGRPFYLGRIGRVRVIVGLTGIGVVNAENTTRAVLDAMDVAAIIFSGVAGSTSRIGEVVVPDDWVQDSVSGAFPNNSALMAVARRAQGALVETLASCTLVPPDRPSSIQTERCLSFQPQLVIGGHGSSGDPYDGPLGCAPGFNLILGCTLPPPPPAIASAAMTTPSAAPGTAPEPDVVDQETAAVARVAAEFDVPFLGIRGISDGPGDPLGERSFPFAQFLDYYVISADNAAIVARSVVAQLDALANGKPGRKACKALAKGKWDTAAELINP
jgi:nucleoside phosphorylase